MIKDNKVSEGNSPSLKTERIAIAFMLGVTLMGSVKIYSQAQSIEAITKTVEEKDSSLNEVLSELAVVTELTENQKEEIEKIQEETNLLQEELQTTKKELVQSKKREEQNKVSRSGTKKQTIQTKDSNMKSYMDYRAITSKSSLQYKLQQQATTNKGYRMLDGRFMIALGSRFGEVGSKGELVLASGKIIPYVIADRKADKHTDSTNTYHLSDGSLVEFVVDSKSMSKSAKKMGNMSYCSYEDMNSPVIQIITY